MRCVERLLPTRRRWSSWAPNAQHGLRETAVDSTWIWENRGNIMGKYSIRSNFPAFGSGEAMESPWWVSFGGLPRAFPTQFVQFNCPEIFFYELTATSVEWCSRGSYPQISLISGPWIELLSHEYPEFCNELQAIHWRVNPRFSDPHFTWTLRKLVNFAEFSPIFPGEHGENGLIFTRSFPDGRGWKLRRTLWLRAYESFSVWEPGEFDKYVNGCVSLWCIFACILNIW